MGIIAGLGTKTTVCITISLLAATGAGIYYLGDYYLSNAISKYEYAFVEFLNDNKNNDIIFDVKKGDGTSDLSDSDLSFSNGDNQKVSVTAKVQLQGNNSSSFKTSGSDTTDQKITQMKNWGGGNWTWECAFEFKKGKDADKNEIKEEYKNRIFKAENKGLFGILKQDISKYNKGEDNILTKEEIRKIKVDFIIQCGVMRGFQKNKKVNADDASALKVTIHPIEFMKKENQDKLSPDTIYMFAYWFQPRHTNTKPT